MSELLLEFRAKNNYTQKQLGDMIGLSPITIASIEKKKKVSIITKGKVGKFFNVNPIDLF